MCASKEHGLEENRTDHDHIYFQIPWDKSPISFNSIKKVFPTAHIEFCNGTAQQNRDYIFKEGKYLNHEKRAERIEGFQWEIGTLPQEQEAKKRQGKRTDLDPLYEAYEMIKQGKTLYDVYEIYPQLAKYHAALESQRKAFEDNTYKNKPIKKEVYYIQGSAGVGKTYNILTKYGKDLYQIDYQAGRNFHYNGYDSESIVLYDEFDMQVNIEELLRQLNDFVFKVNVKGSYRYCIANKFIFVSNIPFENQYAYLKQTNPKQYNALRRRFAAIIDIDENGNEHKYYRVQAKNTSGEDLERFDYLDRETGILYFQPFRAFREIEEKAPITGYDMIEYIDTEQKEKEISLFEFA